MDIIYHRNCLDGVFSAHLFYMMSKVINQQNLDHLVHNLLQRAQSKKPFQSIEKTQQYQRITDLTYQIINQNQTNNNELSTMQQQQTQSSSNSITTHKITDDFFHQPNSGVSYWAYSMYAGQFIPLKFPTKNKILFVLDTNLAAWENLFTIGQRYDVVVLIDHHTSFEPIKKDILINKAKMRKLFYVFSENHCATELCYLFLEKYLKFPQYFQQNHIQNLITMIKYISANDRKHKQTRQSKSFVLGFYYFGLQLSHINPLLNKRIGMLNLDYLMDKGANLYKAHLKDISNQISHAMICRLEMSGRLKGKLFYILEPSNPAKISDIGVVLSFLSKSHGMQNMAMLFMRNSDQYRISGRSHRSLPEPLALQLAEKYQGGGHLCAAGFKVSFQKFKSQFTKIPCDKNKLLITPQQVQKILLNQTLIEQMKE